ncbi:hypothetical protein [Ancylothrix sp. D3o]|nr:hypothetical protein [Ancylothrix sp. D3o]
MQAKNLLTFEEYLTFDDGTDNRYELVDGEARDGSSTNGRSLGYY